MYVCMYVCIYMYVCMYVCIYIYIYVCMYIYIFIILCIWFHFYVCILNSKYISEYRMYWYLSIWILNWAAGQHPAAQPRQGCAKVHRSKICPGPQLDDVPARHRSDSISLRIGSLRWLGGGKTDYIRMISCWIWHNGSMLCPDRKSKFRNQWVR